MGTLLNNSMMTAINIYDSQATLNNSSESLRFKPKSQQQRAYSKATIG